MPSDLFSFLDWIDDSLWIYVGFPVIMSLGLFLTFHSRFAQIKSFPYAVKIFFGYAAHSPTGHLGVHPLKAFFACMSGCVGISNLVAICTAIQIGGPGALFWVWITALIGMIVKYSEVYLGILYRVKNTHEGYDGGPMYFLQRVFKRMSIPMLVAFLLCIYGVEVYQFNILSKSITINYNLDPYVVTGILVVLVIYAGSGGVNRVGQITATVIPFFIVLYVLMGSWVLLHNLSILPSVFKEIFHSAFTGHAATGGFIGSSILVTVSQGIRRGCYTSDIGIGYASVIHSETSTRLPEKQASLTFFDIFLDSYVMCTMSVMLILVTGVWKEPIHESLLVQTALGFYFPYMHLFMPFFLMLLGYSTIISYFCVGMKCAEFLSPRLGKALFIIYSIIALGIFAFHDSTHALTLMSLTQVFLVVINSYGLFRLRREISYNVAS